MSRFDSSRSCAFVYEGTWAKGYICGSGTLIDPEGKRIVRELKLLRWLHHENIVRQASLLQAASLADSGTTDRTILLRLHTHNCQFIAVS